jgi:phage repressor protein C with HTH and peptisase S24 domain
MKTLADRVKEERESRDWSQKELAFRAKVSQSTVGNLEAGINLDPRKLPEIAQALGLNPMWCKTGKGEKYAQKPRQTALVSRQPDEILIPKHDVRASMGEGEYPPDHVEIVKQIAVSLNELRRRAGFSAPQNLSFITGIGDSMVPTFSDGDVLLIDRGVHTVEVDGVFVLTLNGKLYIKTLQRQPDNTILMISDNNKYKSYTITERDSTSIDGRVVLAWNARRL